jgi:type II secretory pathway pseudopilin PulG
MPNGVKLRLRSEEGFGLIELLISMVMLNIGILAIVAAFQSGAMALKRSSKVSTASTLADSQMELYRALTYNQLVLDASAVGTTDNTYRCDTALGGACPASTSGIQTTTCTTPLAKQCDPSRLLLGPDKFKYRVDTYILLDTPPNGRELKKITIVVRDGDQLTKTLARETSTFDPAVSG